MDYPERGKLVVTRQDEVYKIAGPAEQTWRIASPTDLGPIRQGVAESIRGAGMPMPRVSSFLLCVGEAVNNVLIHASVGTASLHRTSTGFIVIVSDHGPGIPAPVLSGLVSLRTATTTNSGRTGYGIMLSFCDKVYLATGPEGTSVTMAMELHPANHSTCMSR